MTDAPELLPPELSPPDGTEDGSWHWIIWLPTNRVSSGPVEWSGKRKEWRDGPDVISAAKLALLGWRYHAPARPDDATERARLEGEVARLREALEMIERHTGPMTLNRKVIASLNFAHKTAQEALRHDPR